MGEPRLHWIARFHGEEKAEAYEVPPGPLEWLVDLMDDAGALRVVSTGMGAEVVGLGWPEIAAWVDGAGENDLSPTFRRAIILLSAHHADVTRGAVDLAFEAPFDPGKAE